MSFDIKNGKTTYRYLVVSIPLEQGNVFRRLPSEYTVENGLNPFGTGQCLSTAVGC